MTFKKGYLEQEVKRLEIKLPKIQQIFTEIKNEIKADDDINISNFNEITNAIKSIKNTRKRWATGGSAQLGRTRYTDIVTSTLDLSSLQFDIGVLFVYYYVETQRRGGQRNAHQHEYKMYDYIHNYFVTGDIGSGASEIYYYIEDTHCWWRYPSSESGGYMYEEVSGFSDLLDFSGTIDESKGRNSRIYKFKTERDSKQFDITTASNVNNLRNIKWFAFER